ncbi:MAG: mechanosensitive ion channel family protein [Candidatus Aminicenantes bacterium]|nr:MAG: mechanosensitive ion channel family protein [Candidatus Aminicenantes bacterium]
MDSLSNIFNSIIGNIYLKFLFILVVSTLVALIVKFIVRQVLKPLAKKTKTKIDDLVIKSISSIIFYVVIVLGFKVGIQHFEFETAVYSSIVNSLFILIIVVMLLRIITNFSKHWLSEWASKTESTADDRLIPLVAKILKAITIILGFFFIFDTWNINLSPLLATAGIAGIAIGFAVRDSLANILGGIQLVLDKTFKVGDKVELESGEMGEILDIGIRSTKLRTYDNEVIYIPNGSLANTKIKNFTVPDLTVRVNVNFGVEYGSDPEKVRSVVLDAIKKIDTVIEPPEPVVQFLNMGDSSLDFVARVWVKNWTEAYSTKLTVTDEIYNALNKANIGIPFPTRTIYTKSDD